MATPQQWKFRLALVEIFSLVILIASLVVLGDASSTTDVLTPLWLLVPAAASLTMFLSFLGLMYLRWVVSAAHERKRIHSVLFAVMAFTLLSVWALAMVQTWQSLQGP